MQNINECLDRAMFIASESYSNSTYESNLSWSIKDPCDEMPALSPTEDWAITSSLAA